MEQSTSIRINKYLAEKGYATRRGADTLVSSGKVFINGRKAVLGDKVSVGDEVEVRGQTTASYVYLAYHKPSGVATSATSRGEKDIASILVSAHKDLFPVGRLDKGSSGLVILTNDGRITDRLLNPKHAHKRTYRVRLDKKIADRVKRIIEGGMDIEGERTKPCVVKVVDEITCDITLEESKKHQIRRMFAALGYTPISISRTQVLNIKLGSLKENQYREIVGAEQQTFLKELGL